MVGSSWLKNMMDKWMNNQKCKPRRPVKFHQVFFGCAVVVIFLVELAQTKDIAAAFAGTTAYALMLAFVVFGWDWLNSTFFDRKE